MDEFQWITLDDFYEQLEKIKKSETEVKGHQRNIGGHTVQVKNYQQHRPDAVTPIIGTSGPIKHLNQPPDNSGMGGKPETQPEKVQVSKILVPDNPATHESCPWCNLEAGKPQSKQQPGQVIPESYAPPQHPTKNKLADEISADDIAHALHRYPYVYNPSAPSAANAGPDEKKWNQLSKPEKEEYLRHNPFSHLGDEGEAALLRFIGKTAKNTFNNVARWKRANDIEGFDEKGQLAEFAHRLAEEMMPYARVNVSNEKDKTDFRRYGTKAFEEAVKENPDLITRALGRGFHQGMNPNKIQSGDDIRREVHARAMKWAVRHLETEAGFNHILNNPEVKASQRLEASLAKLHNEREQLEKQAGFGDAAIKPDASLEDLEKVAKEKKIYRIEKDFEPVKDAEGKVTGEKLKGLELYQDDPEQFFLNEPGSKGKMSAGAKLIYKVALDGTEKPSAKVGTKVNDLRDKMAEMFNPESAGKDTPLGKFKEAEKKISYTRQNLVSLYTKRNELQRQLDQVSLSPEKHLQNVEKVATIIASLGNTAVESINQKGIHNEAVNNIQLASNSITEALEDGKPLEAMTEMSYMRGAINKLKGTVPEKEFKQIHEAIVEFENEFKSYQQKSKTSPDDRKVKIQQTQDAFEKIQDEISSQEAELEHVRDQQNELLDDEYVEKYQDIRSKIADTEAKHEEAKKKAIKFWNVGLESPLGGDDEAMMDNTAPQALKNFKEHEKEMDEGPKEYWADKVPTDPDLEDEENASDVGFKMAMAHAEDPDSAGSYLFGGLGHKAGLIHVADKLLGNYFSDGRVKGVMDKFLGAHKDKSQQPEIFKKYSNLIDDNRRWYVLHRLYEKNPDAVEEYALRLSDYHPFPLATDDIRDEEDKDVDGLRKLIIEGNKTKNSESKTLPQTGNAIERYYMMFRLLGNHIIEEITKDNPNQKHIFETIKELNRPHRGKERVYPGNLRRKLGRRMDVKFGRFAETLPPTDVFPQWKHKVSPENAEDWLQWAQQKTKKSFVVYNDLEKGLNSLYVIFEDE